MALGKQEVGVVVMNGREGRKTPGAATPGEFTQSDDGWLSQQQFEALKRGLRAAQSGFNGPDSRLKHHRLRGNRGVAMDKVDVINNIAREIDRTDTALITAIEEDESNAAIARYYGQLRAYQEALDLVRKLDD